jgi:hypothetical protein
MVPIVFSARSSQSILGTSKGIRRMPNSARKKVVLCMIILKYT